MYQRKDFQGTVENSESQTKVSQLYTISSFKTVGVMDTITTVVEGNLTGKDIKEMYKVILESEMATFTQNANGRYFKFTHIPNGRYYIFIRKGNGDRTLIKPLNFDSGHIYSLEIALKEK